MSDFEKRVDQLIGEFDIWFQSQKNDPIVRSEKAIMKTFCWFLANVKEHSVVPEIQGHIDAVTNQAPTLGDSGETNGQASGS